MRQQHSYMMNELEKMRIKWQCWKRVDTARILNCSQPVSQPVIRQRNERKQSIHWDREHELRVVQFIAYSVHCHRRAHTTELLQSVIDFFVSILLCRLPLLSRQRTWCIQALRLAYYLNKIHLTEYTQCRHSVYTQIRSYLAPPNGATRTQQSMRNGFPARHRWTDRDTDAVNALLR